MKKIAAQGTLIEIQTYFPNNNNSYDISRGDLSTTRINLIQNGKEKSKEVSSRLSELKIKTEFRELLAITNLKSIMIFIYFCLAFDFSRNLYQAYLMTYSLMDILLFEISPIYLIRYFTSLFNAVGLLKIIIVYKDYTDEIKRKKKDIKIKKSADIDDINKKGFDVDFELNVPMPVKNIQSIRMTRLIVWLINTLLFIIVVVINKSLNIHEYLDILFNISECFLCQLMRFYYSVLIRIEAYKEIYELSELK